MECQYIWKIKDRQIRYPVDLSVIDRTFLRLESVEEEESETHTHARARAQTLYL